MHSATHSGRSPRRVSVAIAAVLIAGSGVLAATAAHAADPGPGAGASTSSAAAPLPAAGPGGSRTPVGPADPQAPVTGRPSARPARAATEPQGRVVSRLPLSIREQPTSQSAYLGSIPAGSVISLHCKVVGQTVDGNSIWYLLGAGRPGYVAARYVQNLSSVPWCTAFGTGAVAGGSSAGRGEQGGAPARAESRG